MDLQQITVFAIIIAASIYLGRNLRTAWLRLRNPNASGCASGCGKCAFAIDPAERKPEKRPIAVINASNANVKAETTNGHEDSRITA